MKRRDMLKLAAFGAAPLTTTALLSTGHAFAQDKKWKIGFSQVTTIEP
ncbi:MAG: sugar ABC transporter substrate-binding protein, partial [Mesorhizobium sp.]